MPAQVIKLQNDDADHVTRVLADAFHDYPVMRYVLGATGDYDRRLHQLIRMFVMARALRDEPMYGILHGADLCAVMTTSFPDRTEMPAEFPALRDATWADLGADARERYDRCVAAWQPLAVAAPQIHVNMIGVRRGFHGQGFGRRLLDHVHEQSAQTADSHGVSLTTELPENVRLYQHFGYEIVGHVRVAPELETWGLFRRD